MEDGFVGRMGLFHIMILMILNLNRGTKNLLKSYKEAINYESLSCRYWYFIGLR